MTEYHKIDTVYKRDPETKYKSLLEGQWARDSFGYLAENIWTFTEKVDGTNIRINVAPNTVPEEVRITFGGKTDNAQIPPFLLKRLREIVKKSGEQLLMMFPNGAVLYGEGYGARIQKSGGNYRPDVDFVLFDVLVGRWWLNHVDVLDIGARSGIDVVPTVAEGTLYDMVAMVRGGFNSRWGDFTAEGLIARPKVGLFGRDGSRVIAKLKHKDFHNA